MVVFDPLAICLLLAGNAGLMARKRSISYMTEEEVMKDVDIQQPFIRNTDGHGRDGS